MSMKIAKKAAVTLLLVLVFAVAMGFLEGVVVYYLRMLPFVVNSYNLPAIPNFPKEILFAEQLREAATIIMLVTLAALAGRNKWQRILVFIFAFSVWDLTYYASTYFLMGWPASIFDMDVVFLIPIQWWLPVFVPVFLFTILGIISGYEILVTGEKKK